MLHVLRLLVALGLISTACGRAIAEDPVEAVGAGRFDASATFDDADGSVPSGSTGADHTPPVVLASNPVDTASDVSSSVAVSITFSEPMAAASLNATSFSLTEGNDDVAGVLTYVANTLTFVPAAPLALGAVFAASIGTGATDLAGNPLAASHSWTFTTSTRGGGAHGPVAVALGTSSRFAILSKAGITSVAPAVITGDVGVSPIDAGSITGITMSRAGTRWTAPEVTGDIYAADNDAPTPAMLTTAILDLQSAYTDAEARTAPTFDNLGDGRIDGMTLTPGLYSWPAAVSMAADVILLGGANDTWVFQVNGDLGLGATATMKLQGGAQAKNIYWQVSGAVILAASAHAEGTLMAATSIDLADHASVTGRLLAQTAVHLVMATVTLPAP